MTVDLYFNFIHNIEREVNANTKESVEEAPSSKCIERRRENICKYVYIYSLFFVGIFPSLSHHLATIKQKRKKLKYAQRRERRRYRLSLYKIGGQTTVSRALVFVPYEQYHLPLSLRCGRTKIFFSTQYSHSLASKRIISLWY